MSLLAAFGGALLGTLCGPLLLRAACRFPGVRHTRGRTVLVSLSAGVGTAGLAARLSVDPHGRYALPAVLTLAAVGVVLAVVDLDIRRLPDPITLPAYPVLVLLLAAGSWLSGDWLALLRAAATGAVALALYGVLCLAAPSGLGFGDVKLGGLLGIVLGWLSWATAVAGVALGFVVGALVSLVLLAGRRASWRTEVPFGPSMLVGAWLAVILGDRLAELYFTW